MTQPARSIASLGETISIAALLVTAVTQLYLFLFVLKPVALKAALDEKQAQLNIETRASSDQLARLERQNHELTLNRQTLLEDRQLVSSNTADIQAKLSAANSRDAVARAAIGRLETQLAGREAEQATAAQRLAAARAAAAAQYKAVRPILINDVLESLRNLCLADERAVRASLGEIPEDVLVRVYDDAVVRVRSSVSLAALSSQDRLKFDQLVMQLRRRVEATKALVAQSNSVWAAYKTTFRSEWIRRGGPLDSNGEPAKLSAIEGFTRAEIEAELFRFGRELRDIGGPDPLKLPPVSVAFSAALSQGYKELVPEIFEQSSTRPRQK